MTVARCYLCTPMAQTGRSVPKKFWRPPGRRTYLPLARPRPTTTRAIVPFRVRQERKQLPIQKTRQPRAPRGTRLPKGANGNIGCGYRLGVLGVVQGFTAFRVTKAS